MHEVQVWGVGIEIPGTRPVLLLRETGGDRRVLPIGIGIAELGAMEVACSHVSTPGTGPGGLIAELVGCFDHRLRRASITALHGEDFEAELVLDGDRRIPSRPGDAVVLAVLLGAPIDAAGPVLDRAGIDRGDLVDASHAVAAADVLGPNSAGVRADTGGGG